MTSRRNTFANAAPNTLFYGVMGDKLSCYQDARLAVRPEVLDSGTLSDPKKLPGRALWIRFSTQQQHEAFISCRSPGVPDGGVVVLGPEGPVLWSDFDYQPGADMQGLVEWLLADPTLAKPTRSR